jgi:2-oxoglutarate ferredoxin oxidoreductase subunit gamma
MQQEIVFSGFGGQGVMFVGQLLAYAAMDAGLHVTWIPSYGPEMRGGTAHCSVTISDKAIGSPMVKHPKAAVVFNNPSFDKYEPLVASGGILVVNRSLVMRQSIRTDIDTLYIPATEIADEIGSVKVANLVLLGALLEAHPVLPVSAIETALEKHIAAHRRDLLELNYQALQRGAQFANHIALSPH